jgi:hypothetical protein
MLKQAASFVLASKAFSTYPAWETSCLGSSGWAGEEWYAFGAFIGCGLAVSLFEHPARCSAIWSTHSWD